MNLHNHIQIGDYIYYHPSIGRGAFSKVYYGYHSLSKESVAIKKINKVSYERIKKEIELMKKLNHQNIIKYRDMITDNSKNIYIVNDYCNGGTLKKLLDEHKQFSEKEVKFYMLQIKEALQYLVSNNIYHRDIKPLNIFINYKDKNNRDYRNIELKLGDFGLAKEMNKDNMLDTLCGTPMYMAPEIVYEKKYHINSDLWSVGIILFQMMYGKFPFGKPKNMIQLLKNIDSEILTFPPKNYNGSSSNEVCDLLSRLIQKDPKFRISWDDFFNHQWFLKETIESKEEINEIEVLCKKLKENTISETINNDTNTPINFTKINIIDDYCDRFSSSVPTSTPISIPRKNNNESKKYGTYGGVRYNSPIDTIYKYITESIERLTK